MVIVTPILNGLVRSYVEGNGVEGKYSLVTEAPPKSLLARVVVAEFW